MIERVQFSRIDRLGPYPRGHRWAVTPGKRTIEAPADMLRHRLTRTFGTEIRNATKAGPKLPGIDATDPGPGWPHAGLFSLRR